MNSEIKSIDLDNLGFTPSQELIDMVNDANQAKIKAEQAKQNAINMQPDNTAINFDTNQMFQQPVAENNSIESIQLSAGAGTVDPTLGAFVADNTLANFTAGAGTIDQTPGALEIENFTTNFVPTAAGVGVVDPIPGAIPSVLIQIPSNVHQTGITKNYTNYSYFYGKWNKGTAQRALSEQWNAAGRTSNRGIATLNGRYLVALSPKFGGVGQNVNIHLETGEVIPATIADSKGSDAQSEWGHRLGGGVDVIEWESFGSKDNIDISGWQGVKVSGIERV